jgi:hypothetical protein
MVVTGKPAEREPTRGAAAIVVANVPPNIGACMKGADMIEAIIGAGAKVSGIDADMIGADIIGAACMVDAGMMGAVEYVGVGYAYVGVA